jgi:geranylgeranyl diphosphate synthase type I
MEARLTPSVHVPSPDGDDDIYTAPRTSHDFNPPLERELRQSIEDLEGNAPMLARMARFHLGWIETNGEPTAEDVRQSVQGKRIRPHLAFLSCSAVGGDPMRAAPLAAAIELLHNFTLIHDDIQDRSPNRRHRATVWRIWGDAQAINAGDVLFATAQRALLRTDTSRVPAETLLHLIDEFNQATISIVRGQVLDLEFERQATVTTDEYLTMIGGKTAAIMRYAAWAGAIVGGATESTASRLGDLGEALGIGFQIRDDILGIWGACEATGKDQADDIRRRKKSLPILMLLESAAGEQAERLTTLYDMDEIDESGVAEVLRLLDDYDIQTRATARVAHYHDVAENALRTSTGSFSEASASDLETMIRRLDTRGA